VPCEQEGEQVRGQVLGQIGDQGPPVEWWFASFTHEKALSCRAILESRPEFPKPCGCFCLYRGSLWRQSCCGWHEVFSTIAGDPVMHTETITWNQVSSGQLPDADLTVLVETQGCAEPVWLGYFDGSDWLDIEGTPITVIRWAEMPKGGGA
jgi:hypothetical protein